MESDEVSEIQQYREFKKFYVLEKLSNTLGFRVISKIIIKNKWINKIIE